MKIVDRDAFLKMPEGTVYAMYAVGQMGPLCIKGPSTPELKQFLYSEISVAIVREAGTDPVASLEKAAITGESINLDFETLNCERDVMAKQLFMTWERRDVVALARRLITSLVEPADPPPLMRFTKARVAEFVDLSGQTIPLGTWSSRYAQFQRLLTEANSSDPIIGTIASSGSQEQGLNTHEVSNFQDSYGDVVCDVAVLGTLAGAKYLSQISRDVTVQLVISMPQFNYKADPGYTLLAANVIL